MPRRPRPPRCGPRRGGPRRRAARPRPRTRRGRLGGARQRFGAVACLHHASGGGLVVGGIGPISEGNRLEPMSYDRPGRLGRYVSSRVVLPGAIAIRGAVALALAAAGTAAAKPVRVVQGKHYGHRIFPSDAFTVRDKRQLTGRRVHFRRGRDYPIVRGHLKRRCGKSDYSICDAYRELNKLDGFDLQPRVTVPFTGAIKLASVNAKDFFTTDAKGKRVGGMKQLTFDPQTHTLAGISDRFLQEGKRYRIVVTRGIKAASGKPVRACSKRCVV